MTDAEQGCELAAFPNGEEAIKHRQENVGVGVCGLLRISEISFFLCFFVFRDVLSLISLPLSGDVVSRPLVSGLATVGAVARKLVTSRGGRKATLFYDEYQQRRRSPCGEVGPPCLVRRRDLFVHSAAGRYFESCRGCLCA